MLPIDALAAILLKRDRKKVQIEAPEMALVDFRPHTAVVRARWSEMKLNKKGKGYNE
jgi:hypothetical protein